MQGARKGMTYITGWRGYLGLGSAQHNYAHWTRVELPDGCFDISAIEGILGVPPFEVYAQARLRLAWCSFELASQSRTLLRELAIMCEAAETRTTFGS